MAHDLEAAFQARSIAIVGASNKPSSRGYSFILHLKNYGYQGQIYPVTPNCDEVLGMKTYPKLTDISGSVDYVISCLPAEQLSCLLKQCAERQVKFVHLYTARLSETGKMSRVNLESELLKEARKYSIRLIGPNCMGIYYPKQGRAFNHDFPLESGGVGVFSQSGGNATELIHYSCLRGVRFSKVISYGNALDLNEADFLDYLIEDPETQIIAGYVEGVRDGQRFFRSLKRGSEVKPIIILKAGRSSAGAGSAASHTAALSGSNLVWTTAMHQAGAIHAESLEGLIDLLVSFYFLRRTQGKRVGIVGGGGGRAVLSADEWEEAGFTVPALPESVEQYIRRKLPDLWWGWIRNPFDVSILGEKQRMDHTNIEIIRMMAKHPIFDLLVANVTVGGPFEKKQLVRNAKREVEEIIEITKEATKPVIFILNTGDLTARHFDDWRWRGLAEINERLVDVGFPVYRNSRRAASAIIRMVDYFTRVQLVDSY